MRVIFFNGPPGGGKDTAVQLVQKNDKELSIAPALHLKLATPLKDACHALMMHQKIKEYQKAEAVPGFDLTWRELYIAMSEKFAKPLLGADFFGKMALKQMAIPNATYLFSDSGFATEVVPIIKRVGPGNCLVVRLIRPKCAYTGDSRNYLTPDQIDSLGVHSPEFVDIENRHSLELFEAELIMRIGNWRARIG